MVRRWRRVVLCFCHLNIIVVSIIRVYNRPSVSLTNDWIEMETRLGPIPIADGLGKEVIHRFQTPIISGDYWYTDSSFEEMQLRIRNYRPTWKLNVTEPGKGKIMSVSF
jgi:hypothetical protein